MSDKNGFGALPIQRITKEEAAKLLRKAVDGGMSYIDTARAYSDSEEKIGYALSDVRHKLTIATKTTASTAEQLREHLETSLRTLKTDYIDVYQLHNPPYCPKPGDEAGLYDALLEAKRQGKIRFIAITNHRLPVGEEAVHSGLYDLLQFPFSYLADEKDIALVELCKELDVGFVAMKALSGGLIGNSAAAYAYLADYPTVLPIWGVQRESELDEFLSYGKNPPAMTDELRAVIDADREQLVGAFCRACGYCMPCPVGIEISNAARMSQLIRRAPSANFLTPAEREKMNRVADCLHCGQCSGRCPYGLDTPALLEQNYADYLEIVAGKAV